MLVKDMDGTKYNVKKNKSMENKEIKERLLAQEIYTYLI